MTITILARKPRRLRRSKLQGQVVEGGQNFEYYVLDKILNVLHVFSFHPHNNSIWITLYVQR